MFRLLEYKLYKGIVYNGVLIGTWKFILVSGHSENIVLFTLVLYGNVIVFNAVQFWNAELPIVVTEFGMVMDFRPEQLLNAVALIVVTEFGMVTDVKL